MKPLKIGIGGLGTAGKDTLCRLLNLKLSKLGIVGTRMALADELKDGIQEYLLKEFGIDVWNCTPEQKELIRPYLVEYGKTRRVASKGQYWTSLLQQKIDKYDTDVVIIPDIRYDFFEHDEVDWIKDDGGILIHVARYKTVDGVKNWLNPPNKDEEENDPKVRAKAHFSLSWDSLPQEELLKLYGGFLETIALCTNVELKRIDRHAAN